MRALFKWTFRGVVFLLAAALLLGLLAFAVLRSTIPPANFEVELADLESTVNVVFDREAVPHITAAKYDDAIQVLGYVHARDRLWQMEVLRMAGQGRLSEMFGEATLNSDRFLRTLGMDEASKESFEKLQPETRKTLEAYVAGINAYIDRETGGLEPSLAAEFLILGHEPEAWEPWQSVLIIKVMGLTLASNMDHEITRFALAMNGFSSKEIDDLIPYGPRDNPTPLPDLLEIYGIRKPAKVSGTVPRKSNLESVADYSLSWPTGQSASNNWVISGDRTESGKPILANDPHLGLTAPSVFYLAHVSWTESGETRDVIGGTIPGVPFVVVGRNDHIAWGLTTTNLDAQDLFLEKVDESAGTYMTESGEQELKFSETDINFGTESPEKLRISYTRNGPVLPDSYGGIGDILPDGFALSLSWPGLADDDTTLDTLNANNNAKTVEEFVAAGKRSVSPMQSVVVADTEGNIGLVAKARSPRRKPENLIRGRAPVPGWLAKYQWDGYVPDWQMLAVINPTEGAMTTANANFLPPSFKEHITYDWAEHFRQARAEELIVKRTSPHTMQSSLDAIGDTYSPAMVQFRDLAFRIMPRGLGLLPEVRSQLSGWDGRMDSNRPEPLIMLAWFRHLNIKLFEDDLGDLFSKFERGRITRILGVLQRSGARNWCDNRNTSQTEDCADTLTEALQAAYKELETEYGADWRAWEYGSAHVAYNEHRPFGQVKPLADFFNIVTPASGGPYTLLRGQTKFQHEKPYRSRHGSAYRAIYDLNDLDNSLYIQSTGQSGNFISPFYDNLSKRWADVKFLKMSTRENDYSENAVGRWVFRP